MPKGKNANVSTKTSRVRLSNGLTGRKKPQATPRARHLPGTKPRMKAAQPLQSGRRPGLIWQAVCATIYAVVLPNRRPP